MNRIALAVFALVSLFVDVACAQTAPTTTTTRTRALVDDEPIMLPKQEAGRVSARVNERPAVSSVIVREDRMTTQRIAGVTTIRVTPEIGLPYSMSNGQAGNQLRSRELDQFRVPMWQIGKF